MTDTWRVKRLVKVRQRVWIGVRRCALVPCFVGGVAILVEQPRALQIIGARCQFQRVAAQLLVTI